LILSEINSVKSHAGSWEFPQYLERHIVKELQKYAIMGDFFIVILLVMILFYYLYEVCGRKENNFRFKCDMCQFERNI